MRNDKFCRDCGCVVEPEDWVWEEFDSDVHASEYYKEEHCPICGGTNLDDKWGECLLCGEYIAEDAVLCKGCEENAKNMVLLIIEKLYANWDEMPKSQKEDVLEAIAYGADKLKGELK